MLQTRLISIKIEFYRGPCDGEILCYSYIQQQLVHEASDIHAKY